MDIHFESESILKIGEVRYSCRIGKGGLVGADAKREGDGATPRGIYPLRLCLYRPDRISPPPQTKLPLVALRDDMGWCDDPHHARYNQLVRLPFTARHETLWREDSCYDLIIPLGYNDDPIVSGRGSAIFLHVMHNSGWATEGCVAMHKADLLEALPTFNETSRIHILP